MGKKEKNCDPEDPTDQLCGDHWDHVALDAEQCLVVSVVPGERTTKNVEALVNDFKRRTGGRLMNLITTDEYAVYQTQILEAYGTQIVPPRTGKRGRPASAYKVAPPDLKYAVVHKTRENGRVVKIDYRVVSGRWSR